MKFFGAAIAVLAISVYLMACFGEVGEKSRSVIEPFKVDSLIGQFEETNEAEIIEVDPLIGHPEEDIFHAMEDIQSSDFPWTQKKLNQILNDCFDRNFDERPLILIADQTLLLPHVGEVRKIVFEDSLNSACLGYQCYVTIVYSEKNTKKAFFSINDGVEFDKDGNMKVTLYCRGNYVVDLFVFTDHFEWEWKELLESFRS